MFDNTTEDFIQPDDAALTARGRALIMIGRDGIAGGDQQALEAYFHPTFRFHGPGGGEVTREDLWAFFAGYRSALEDFTVERRAVIDQGGEYMSARTSFSGVFTRPLELAPMGTLQPTGEPFDFDVINIFRVDAEDRLVEEWALYDTLLVMAKLGVDVGSAAGSGS
ncbi:ester cyclase [Auraticoccus monumenti]|uniref:SnoaL-like domain-containing protein n=1 Tax=Auraticoccus monumenti TaxID=675864 RepID=A0A1G6SS83_9ACTN|nr:nuclear transport factor 2 family protein [Auraticoccus monumenti]SDD19077.1 SnoaL-like domain-containing protein [Auraticoccus monumenti]